MDFQLTLLLISALGTIERCGRGVAAWPAHSLWWCGKKIRVSVFNLIGHCEYRRHSTLTGCVACCILNGRLNVPASINRIEYTVFEPTMGLQPQ